MSIPSSMSARISFVAPYRLIIGTPVRKSVPSATCTPSSTSPRIPCSGPNKATSLIPVVSRRRSAVEFKLESTPVGFVIRPTRRPETSSKWLSKRRSFPNLIAIFNSTRFFFVLDGWSNFFYAPCDEGEGTQQTGYDTGSVSQQGHCQHCTF